MDASAGLIITAVLAGLLCLRRRRCRMPDEAMHDLKRRQTASHWMEREQL